MRTVPLLICAWLGVSSVVLASDKPVQRGAEFSAPYVPVSLDIDLRDLHATSSWKPGDPIKNIPRRFYRTPPPPAPFTPQVDRLLALQERGMKARKITRDFDTPDLNFAGEAFTGSDPPDTVGDVGLDYYIQAVNNPTSIIYTVYDKTNGNVVAGPLMLQQLFTSNVTCECAIKGGGDPIVIFDSIANRWLLSEFTSDANDLCVYISKTSDPVTGGWWNYEFNAPYFPDYPKYGVWTNAYFVSSNEDPGPAAYALEREAMLNGQPARMQRFQAPTLSGFGFQALTPADIDGPNLPPDNMPGLFLRHNDDELHSGAPDGTKDFLELFEFEVDWDTPANSTFTGPIQIPVASFDSTLCANSIQCIPQPGSAVKLDSIREVVLHRLIYRNFISHQVLAGCFAVDVNGSDHIGLRWFELRNSGAGWTNYQEGTYAPDSHHRWLGSLAMDGNGNIAMGYNISSSSVHPGLRYAGRLAGDPLGSLPQSEYVIANGSAANFADRYGDYSSMSVDPVDDCQFWFTGEYNTSADWSTRITSFRFDTCGCDAPPAPGNVTTVSNNAPVGLVVSWDSEPSATYYNLYRALGSCPQLIYSLTATGITGNVYTDTTVSAGAAYSYVVTSLDAGHCESSNSSCSSAIAPGTCGVMPTFSGALSADPTITNTCCVYIDWEEGTPNCGTSLVYNLYRDTNSLFSPGPDNLLARCLTETEFFDYSVESGRSYTYIVRAEDGTTPGSGGCLGGLEDNNTTRRTALVSGAGTSVFTEDFESGLGQWTTYALPADASTSPWQVSVARVYQGSHSGYADDPEAFKDQVIQVTAPITVQSPTAELSFWKQADLEDGFDGVVLEYSTDYGTNWHDILSGDGGAVPSNGTRFISNGYDVEISNGFNNVLSGRWAWSLWDNETWRQARIDIGDFAGSTVVFRWRIGTDDYNGYTVFGFWIDEVVIQDALYCSPGGYEAWRTNYTWSLGTGARTEDENMDGVLNYEAYMHGVSPTGTLTQAEWNRLPNLVYTNSQVQYRFTVDTNKVRAGRFLVESTPDVLRRAWSPPLPQPVPTTQGEVLMNVSGSAPTSEIQNLRLNFNGE